MALRDYAGNAKPSSLTAGINNTALSFSIPPADAANWPTGGGNGKFFVTLDRGLPSEERILVSSQSGGTFTIASLGDRGVDGTTAVAHSVGAAGTVEHTYSSIDAEEANAHINNAALDHHTQYMLASGTRHDLAARHTFAALGWTPGAPTNIAPDDTAAEGTGAHPARGDHRHSITAATPVAIGTALAEGVAANFARSDHVHELGTGSIDTAAFFVAGIVDTAAIGALQVTEPKIADNAVISRIIADGAIDTIGYFSTALRPVFTGAAAPGTPATDQIWWDTTNDILKVYNGTNWKPLAQQSQYIVRGQGSASFSSESVKDVVVSFGVTFTADPTIVITPRGTNTAASAVVNADSTTGFTARIQAGATITGTITFNWIAIGDRNL